MATNRRRALGVLTPSLTICLLILTSRPSWAAEKARLRVDDYKIEATFLRTRSAATKLLDHMDGWEKVYSDDIATIHLRKANARHNREPVVNPVVR